MKKLFVCGAFILALSSCKSGWTSAQKDEFVKTCTNAASGAMGEEKAKDYCTCMQGKVESKYPNAADAGKLTADETTTLAKECLK